MSALSRNPGRHVHFSRLDWLRVTARLAWELHWKPAVLRWYLMLRAHVAALRPGRTRPARPGAAPEGPATPPAGRGTAPVPPRRGAVPHYGGQSRQPWDTAGFPAVPACETEPVRDAETYTCQPWQAVPGFYRHHIWQQYRRLS